MQHRKINIIIIIWNKFHFLFSDIRELFNNCWITLKNIIIIVLLIIGYNIQGLNAIIIDSVRIGKQDQNKTISDADGILIVTFHIFSEQVHNKRIICHELWPQIALNIIVEWLCVYCSRGEYSPKLSHSGGFCLQLR